MRIGKKNFDNKSILLGVGVSVALMTLPKISEPVIKIITSIRDKIGGKA